MEIINYINGTPVTPGVTYKLSGSDTHSAWVLTSDRPVQFKLTATEPTDSAWTNITEDQYIIEGKVQGQLLNISNPAGKFFVVATHDQDPTATVESTYATVALKPLGFDYATDYPVVNFPGDDTPISAGFYKMPALTAGKLYSINISPDLGGLKTTNPTPEFAFALFSVNATNNPKALLAAGISSKQLVFVATEADTILNLSSTIEGSKFFVSIRNFSLGSGFDPSSDQEITGAWSFTNSLTLADEAQLILGSGANAVKIHGTGEGNAVIEGSNSSKLDVAIPMNLQEPVTVNDLVEFPTMGTTDYQTVIKWSNELSTFFLNVQNSDGNLFLGTGPPGSPMFTNLNFVADINGGMTFNDVTIGKSFTVNGPSTFKGSVMMTQMLNANGGINIPLATGAITDTAAVNRFYASGLAGAAVALTQPIYIKSNSISLVGSLSKWTNETLPGLMQGFLMSGAATGAETYGTAITPLTGITGYTNYSSVCGFSIAVNASTFAKFTFGIGRGPRTTRTGLTMDSYAMIPGNNLASGIGEVVDVTINAPYDTARKGYEFRVREIFYMTSVGKWQVKTTTVFLPVNSNWKMPNSLNRLIYMQSGDPDLAVREEKGALYMELGAGNTNTLVKIASLRGYIGFEATSGLDNAGIVLDMRNTGTGVSTAQVAAGTRHLYSNGLTNPTYYALEAMADNIIESEEIADFVDINIPVE